MSFSPYNIRTDLALESANTVAHDEGLPDGISVNTFNSGGFTVTEVTISKEEASKRIGKAMGRYLTLEPETTLELTPANADESARAISCELNKLLHEPKSILVVGLGNDSITPDSLGPRVSEHIFATRHIHFNAPELAYDGLKSVSTIAAGVMGQTGIETQELLLPLIKSISPEAVIVVDALACSDVSHLGRTIQLTDTGISPGSGVMNARKELSNATLGIPCIAIGVPTVADAGGDGKTLMVTPKNIDKLVSSAASLISGGINMSLHPSMTLEELRLLTS